jgi:hypothetical protein
MEFNICSYYIRYYNYRLLFFKFIYFTLFDFQRNLYPLFQGTQAMKYMCTLDIFLFFSCT